MESIRKINVKQLQSKIEELIANGVEFVDITTLPLKNKIKFIPLKKEEITEITEITAA